MSDEALGGVAAVGVSSEPLGVSSEPLIHRIMRKNKDTASVLKNFKAVMTMAMECDRERDDTIKEPSIIQWDIADYLQNGDEQKDRMDPTRWWLNIQAPRGFGKTYIVAKYVAFLLRLDPTLKIMIVSKNEEFAKKILMEVRNNIETCVLFQELRPGPDAPSDNKTSMYVTGAIGNKDPSLVAYSVEGKLQGMRADVIIGDDVESTQNSNTVNKREALSHAVKEFVNILKPGGMIILLGTPQTNDTIYHRLLNNGYSMRIWPALYPKKEQMDKPTYGPYVAPFIRKGWTPEKVGQLVDPKRFSQKELDIKKKGLDGECSGESDFELQFMLDPTLSDVNKFPLRASDLIVYTPATEMQPLTGRLVVKVPVNISYSGLGSTRLQNAAYELYEPSYTSSEVTVVDEILMAIDPAGSGEDEAGYAVVARLGGRVYLLDSGGFYNGTSIETRAKLAQIAKKWSVNTVVVEKNWGGGMYGSLFKPDLEKVHACNLITDFQAKGQKEVRIIKALEPLLNSHRLIVSKSVITQDTQVSPRRYSLLDQLTSITKDKQSLQNDDRLDALAIACEYLKDKLKVQAEIAEQYLGSYANRLDNALNVAAVYRDNFDSRWGTDADEFGRGSSWTDNIGLDLD